MLPKAPTAASGVRKLGMVASASTARALPTDESPIQQASSGLFMGRGMSASALAVAAASAPALGEKMASTPSTWLSAQAASMAAR